MRYPTSLIVLCLGLTLCLPNFSQAQQPCATDHIHQKLMQIDPEYRQQIKAKERKIREYLANGSRSRSMSTNDTIPVVVHVLHTGQAVGSGYNISDAQIQSSIDRLNEVFADYDGAGTDTYIRFALATRDPSGCTSSTGINRIDATGVNSYETVGITTDADRVDLFNLSRWNTEEYLNFWVVSEIDDNNGNDGTQGFATFSNTSHRYDGVVCMYNTTGYDPTGSNGYNLKSTSNQNETVIHEFGHYLDLYHTFQEMIPTVMERQIPVPAMPIAGTNGDCCSDTDVHQRTYSNVCWSGVTNSCTGSVYGNVVKNYMAYSSQDCKDRFTDDQVARMQAVLTTGRAGLMTSPGLKSVSISEPTAACDATTGSDGTSGNYGVGITKITVGSWTTESGNAYEDGGYVDNWCNHLELEPNTTYSYSVSTAGNYNEYLRGWIDYNNDGTFTNASELVISPSNFGSSFSGTFTTPSSVTYDTPLRFRLRASAITNSTDACFDPTYSQAEDYAVNFANTAILDASVASLSGIHTLTCCAADAQSFTLGGDGLSNDVTLNLSGSNFEISDDDINYSNSLTFTESGGNIQGEPVTVYVRLKSGLSKTTYADNLTISSSPAGDVVIALSGTVEEIDEVRGNAFTINSGSSSNYAIADSYTGISGGDSRTYEAWIKTTATTATNAAFLANGVNSSGQKWIIRMDGGQLRVEINGANIRGTTIINDNEWHHIAVVVDNSGGANLGNTTLYVDGEVETLSGSSNTSLTINTANSQNLWLGFDHSNRYFEGQMDEVRIWSVARTQSQIREMMHLTLGGQESGLEAYYQFNESSGTIVSEKIHGYNLTLNGSATFAESKVDVAKGTCSTVSVGATGGASVEVNSNGVEIDFSNGGTAPDGDLMIYLLEDGPAGGNGANYEATQHWVVRNFGNNQSGLDLASIEFTLPTSDPLLTYDETTMSLYKRASGSEGSWTTVATEALTTNPATGEIFFNSLTGFTSFSQLSIGNSGLLLPVTWESFTAIRSNSREVQLDWATGEELHCLGFEIERSYDGQTFHEVDFVSCQGVQSGTAYYRQSVPESQAAYYRLRQLDVDGKYTYSEVRFVDGEGGKAVFYLYPNPTNGVVYLQTDSSDPEQIMELEVMGMNGQRLLYLEGRKEDLNEALNAHLAILPKGLVMVRLQMDGLQYVQRLVIQ